MPMPVRLLAAHTNALGPCSVIYLQLHVTSLGKFVELSQLVIIWAAASLALHPAAAGLLTAHRSLIPWSFPLAGQASCPLYPDQIQKTKVSSSAPFHRPSIFDNPAWLMTLTGPAATESCSKLMFILILSVCFEQYPKPMTAFNGVRIS